MYKCQNCTVDCYAKEDLQEAMRLINGYATGRMTENIEEILDRLPCEYDKYK